MAPKGGEASAQARTARFALLGGLLPIKPGEALRDAFAGLTRFDEFSQSLGVAPNILTRRLNDLVEAGLLERRPYCKRPLRYEYALTERGRDFRPVMWAMLAYGNRHFAPEGANVQIVDRATGAAADPILVDRLSGRPIVCRWRLIAGLFYCRSEVCATDPPDPLSHPN